MKKNWFSMRLYEEALKQLRIMGILFTVAAGLVAVFIPVGEFLSTLHQQTTVQNVTYLEMNPLIILSFCIVAPFLTLNVFSFLNKRESSDFYHAIPATRTCLFFSFFAAAVTWLLIYMTTTTLLSVVCHALFPALYTINFASVLVTFFNCFAGGVLVAASVAMAVSITGTMLMNVLVALLIIFLPRIFIQQTLICISNAFPLVENLLFAPLFNTQYNVPAGYILQYFMSGDSTSPITTWASGIYTLAVAAAYTAFALLLFRRRQSEAASQSAPNRYLQGLFRFLVGFSISGLVTFSVFTEVHYGTINESQIAGWMFLYLFAVFAMLAFEVLCTRRFKGLLRRGGVTLLLMIAANAALLGGVTGVTKSMQAYAPGAQDISSVRVIDFENDPYYYGYSDYFTEQTADIALTDNGVRQMVSQQLRHTLDLLETSPALYREERYNSSSLVVAIRSGGREHLRRIIVYSEDVDLLSAALSRNAEYREVYMNLPTNYRYISANVGNGFRMDAGPAAQTFYNVLQDEVRSIGFEKWYAHLNGRYAKETYDDTDTETVVFPFPELQVVLPTVSDWVGFTVGLDADVLPRTTAAFLALYNNENAEQRTELLNTLATDPTTLDYLDCYSVNYTDNNGNFNWWWDTKPLAQNADDFRTWAGQLLPVSENNIDPHGTYIFLNGEKRVRKTDGDNYFYEYKHFSGYYAIPAEMTIPQTEDVKG